MRNSSLARIIFSSPTYYDDASAPMKKLFDRSVKIHGKLEGKIGAGFTSSGSVASGAETIPLSLLQAMLIHGMII
jgi:NAD(P)H dehydrogenase (quinone)